MKKILFIVLLFLIKQVNAQCTVTVNSDTICAGTTATLTASGANSYTWSTGDTTASIIVTPTITITYTVIGSTNTCTTTNTTTVMVKQTPTITVISPPPVCAGGVVQSPTITSNPSAANIDWINPCTSIGYPSSGVNQPKSSLLSFTSPNTTNLISCSLTITPVLNGCQGSSATETIVIYPNPTVSVTTNTVTLCAGNTATLTASGANTYIWSTTQIGISISVTPTITTSYTVVGKDTNGCRDTVTITQTVTHCSGAGIEQQVGSNWQLSIYPNPTSTIINIGCSLQLI